MPTAGRLHYLDAPPRAGVRPRGTLLLLHAFPLNARMWERQLDTFSDRGWHVVAPHFRGFGDGGDADRDGAPDRRPPSTIDDLAGDVIDLLDALHAHEAVVAGLSMGGYVALAMLRLAPRYFQAFVLADTRPQSDTPEGAAGRLRMAQLARDRGIGAVADELIGKLVSEATRHDKPAVVAAIHEIARENSIAGVAAALECMRTRPDSSDLLASIHVPTLIVVGSDDAITPPNVSEAMHRAIAGSILKVIPDSGHLSNLEQPDRFDEALAEFLDHQV